MNVQNPAVSDDDGVTTSSSSADGPATDGQATGTTAYPAPTANASLNAGRTDAVSIEHTAKQGKEVQDEPEQQGKPREGLLQPEQRQLLRSILDLAADDGLRCTRE